MRKLKIMEHISLDGVIQHSADDDGFPYGDWSAPYRALRGGTHFSPRRAITLICCLAAAPTICGRASGRRRRAVRWRMESMRRQNIS